MTNPPGPGADICIHHFYKEKTMSTIYVNVLVNVAKAIAENNLAKYVFMSIRRVIAATARRAPTNCARIAKTATRSSGRPFRLIPANRFRFSVSTGKPFRIW
jgi:hypothetical protein